MEDQVLFWVIGFLVVVVVGAAVAAFRLWRRSQDEDERASFIFDTIDKLLSTLVTETRQKLSDLSPEQVNEAARVVWTRVIAPTPLSIVIPVDVFVDADAFVGHASNKHIRARAAGSEIDAAINDPRWMARKTLTVRSGAE